MAGFKDDLSAFLSESLKIQKEEIHLKESRDSYNKEFFGWLKDQGLKEPFTLPELMDFTLMKAND